MVDEPPAEPLEVLSVDECVRLLRAADLGRVAFAAGERTEIFPVSYVVGDDALVFRTAPGSKLDHLPLARVAFEVDGRDGAAAWSVVVHGVAHDITDTLDSRSEELRSLSVTPLAPGHRVHWIQIRREEVSGRRFPVG